MAGAQHEDPSFPFRPPFPLSQLNQPTSMTNVCPQLPTQAGLESFPQPAQPFFQQQYHVPWVQQPLLFGAQLLAATRLNRSNENFTITHQPLQDSFQFGQHANGSGPYGMGFPAPPFLPSTVGTHLGTGAPTGSTAVQASSQPLPTAATTSMANISLPPIPSVPSRIIVPDINTSDVGQLQRTVKHKCTFPPCELTFDRPAELARHLRTHTGEKPYACLECEAAFRQKSHLKEHQKVHTGEKKHTCTHGGCGANFNNTSSLKKHERTHTGERPYVCTYVGCNAAFSVSSALARHMRMHTGERTHRCTVDGCGIVCKDSDTLQRHLKNHVAGSRLYTCPESGCGQMCGQMFSTATDMMVHRRSHSRRADFVCTVCGEVLPEGTDLTEHVTQHQQHVQGDDRRNSGPTSTFPPITRVSLHPATNAATTNATMPDPISTVRLPHGNGNATNVAPVASLMGTISQGTLAGSFINPVGLIAFPDGSMFPRTLSADSNRNIVSQHNHTAIFPRTFSGQSNTTFDSQANSDPGAPYGNLSVDSDNLVFSTADGFGVPAPLSALFSILPSGSLGPALEPTVPDTLESAKGNEETKPTNKNKRKGVRKSQAKMQAANKPTVRKKRRVVGIGEGDGFRCAMCGLLFRLPEHLSNHLRTFHGDFLPYVCPHLGCGMRFELSEDYASHAMSHAGETPYTCRHPGCTERYEELNPLLAHLSSQHDRAERDRFWCPLEECGKKFETTTHLKRHIVHHTAERNHACEFPGCLQSFALPHHLKTHMLTHTRDKQHACTIPGCGASYEREAALRKHISKKHANRVLGAKTFPCTHEGCGRVFSEKDALKKHTRIHTGEKPHACLVEGCGARFAQSGNLTAHIRRHTGDKPFQCLHVGCGLSFRQSGQLRSHVRRHQAAERR